MKNFWKKYKEAITIIIFMSIFVALFYFVIKPQFANIDAKVEKIQESTTSQERRADRLNELPMLREQFNSIQNEKENMQVILSQSQIVVLIKELEKVAEETGNNIEIEIEEEKDKNKRIKEQKKKEKKEDIIDTLPIDNYVKMDITLTGKYNDFVNFVKKIESMRYWSDIISFKLSKKSNSLNRSSDSSPFSASLNNESEKNESEYLSSTVEIIFYLK